MAKKYTDANPKYWREYTKLQFVKHQLIHEYINGWFPKVGFKAKQIVYVDTHAGRGTHLTGELGSPLVALKCFKDHAAAPRILADCKVVMRFVERDAANYEALQAEIQGQGDLPVGLSVKGTDGDCFELLSKITEWVESRWCPSFFFIDPYGFRVPGQALRKILACGGSEVFVNVMSRELDMAIRQGPDSPQAPVLDLVFGAPDWRSIVGEQDYEERMMKAVELLQRSYGAKWATYFRMLGANEKTRYVLLHLSNSDHGRSLMKECMWKVCPQGGFYARKSESPYQEVLIRTEPNLQPLRQWALDLLGQERTWEELEQTLRSTMWLSKHLTVVLKGLHAEGLIKEVDGAARLIKKRNPRMIVVPAGA